MNNELINYKNINLIVNNTILRCLSEIGYTYPDGEYLNLIYKDNMYIHMQSHISYDMVYEFLEKTYGISIKLVKKTDTSDYYVILYGIDNDNDMYQSITHIPFSTPEQAYKTACLYIVSDLNWRHVKKREFSRIK